MKRFVGIFFSALILFYIQSNGQQNPDIKQIIESVNLDSLSTIVKELSGEIETTINGSSIRINSRHADVQGNVDAADYLEQKLAAYGYTVINQTDRTCRNVYTELAGTTNPQQKYVFCAHYDSINDYGQDSVAPGADDNASGVAVVLEAARILKNYLPKYTIVFILFDEEEINLIGSDLYASQQGTDVLGAINMDMLAYDHNNDRLIEVHVRNIANSQNLANAIINVNSDYSLGMDPYIINPGTEYSDQYSFWMKDISAVGLLEDENDFSPYYHSSSDLFSTFNMDYFLGNAKLGIGSLAYLSLPEYVDTTDTGSTAIDAGYEMPVSFSLNQNYPNPFNPVTTIKYSLPENTFVSIKVFDLLGREVTQLVNTQKSSGNHEVKFDARHLPSGVYLYTLKSGSYVETRKMILTK